MILGIDSQTIKKRGENMVVFIGCSSSNDVDKLYIEETKKLAQMLCEHNCTLMFGSSEDGMMGTIYKVFKENNCKVISVLPKENYGMLQEVDSDEKIFVSKTSDQLKYLVNNGDITIILPGSFGTLSELMTSIQCKKLGEHNKPIIIFNINGFYDKILEQFEKFKEEKFDLYDQDELYEVINDYREIGKYLSKGDDSHE